LTTPPGKLTGKAKTIHLTARAVEELNLLEIDKKDEKVGWEVRVCVNDVAYDVVFVDASTGEEEVLQSRGVGNYLKADEGVAKGEWTAKGAGKILCRIRNENAWFKGRVVACRACNIT